MSNLIHQFQFDGTSIRVLTDDNGEPWFNANEVCGVLGFGNPHQAISTHVDVDDLHRMEVIDVMGRKQMANHVNESGLYALIFGSTKEEAKRFKRLVTHEILPEIRKTGSYSAKRRASTSDNNQLHADAFKLVPLVVRAARALGLDKNAAAISANQAVAKLTGTNVLNLLGFTHLEAENQKAMFFTPTELGQRMGVSGRKFNMLLAEAGLQAKKGEHWVPLEAAEGFCRIMDTGKRHGDGTMVQQVKWAENVLELMDKSAA